MSSKQALVELLEQLPEQRVQEILDFARFISVEADREPWAQFGREQLAQAYGPDEPEYTLDDLKPPSDQ